MQGGVREALQEKLPAIKVTNFGNSLMMEIEWKN
jgi:hypothetical protein